MGVSWGVLASPANTARHEVSKRRVGSTLPPSWPSRAVRQNDPGVRPPHSPPHPPSPRLHSPSQVLPFFHHLLHAQPDGSAAPMVLNLLACVARSEDSSPLPTRLVRSAAVLTLLRCLSLYTINTVYW